MLITFSCEKYQLPDESTDPVFFFKGNLNGQQEELVAGMDGYYMFSDFELIEKSYYQFNGTLQSKDCENCPTLTIKINDKYPGLQQDQPNIDQAVMPGNFDYFSPAQHKNISLSLRFEPISNGEDPINYEWNFGDGSTSTTSSPVHTFNNGFSEPVCLTITDANGCQSSICNFVAPDTAYVGCNSKFNSKYLSGNYYMFVPRAPDKEGNEYYWTFGDDSTSYEREPVKYFADTGTYKVCLTVASAYTQCINSYSMNVTVPQSENCSAGFGFKSVADSNIFAYSTVTVEYKSADGKFYTTDFRENQPTSSYFSINKREPYKTNENGFRTRKLNIDLSCTLYNKENPEDKIELKNGKAIWSIAFPD